MTGKKANYPTVFNSHLAVKDHSCEVLGHDGNKSGTMILRGWHPNYADFEHEDLKGCISFHNGTIIVIEVDKRRFQLDLESVVLRCVELTKRTKRK